MRGPWISIHCSANPVSWMLPTSRWIPTAGLFTSFKNCQNSRGLMRNRCSALQFSHLNVRGGQLKPRHVAQPELDAVEPGLLDEVQTLLESPLLANHVIADGFLHKRASYSK